MTNDELNQNNKEENINEQPEVSGTDNPQQVEPEKPDKPDKPEKSEKSEKPQEANSEQGKN
jgi:hypothetical protein